MTENDSLKAEFYKEFFLRAENGCTTARAIFVHRYTTMREEMPDYCIEYVEKFIQNVAYDIGHGKNVTKKFFPNDSRKVDFKKQMAVFSYFCDLTNGFAPLGHDRAGFLTDNIKLTKSQILDAIIERFGYGDHAAVLKVIRKAKAVKQIGKVHL
jgi:hypothetical protein